jgi:hypothetical protein
MHVAGFAAFMPPYVNYPWQALNSASPLVPNIWLMSVHLISTHAVNNREGNAQLKKSFMGIMSSVPSGSEVTIGWPLHRTRI